MLLMLSDAIVAVASVVVPVTASVPVAVSVPTVLLYVTSLLVVAVPVVIEDDALRARVFTLLVAVRVPTCAT
jgi:hypothetical protein